MLVPVCLAAAIVVLSVPSLPQSESPRVARVKAFVAVRERSDHDAARRFLAPDARAWFDRKEGPGAAWTIPGTWHHWDTYFHGRSVYSDWRDDGDRVTARVDETNDYYRLLDWTPSPMRFTWWLDGDGRLSGFLLEPLTAEKGGTGRLEEFKAWARQAAPDELAYLMPKGSIDPTGDRPERWRAILVRWRREAGLPPVALDEE